MTLVWTRIDQKLIHGQIVLAWVPHLKIDAIVAASGELEADPRSQRFIKMGLPSEIRAAVFVAPETVAEALETEELRRRRVLLLFKDMEGVTAALKAGLSLTKINLGYHACAAHNPAIARLGETFDVCEGDLAGLRGLYAEGLEIILQTLPTDRAVRWTPAG